MTKCPACGFEFDAKAKLGEGTQSAKKARRLGQNKLTLLKLISDENQVIRPLTVYEISKMLFAQKIMYKTRSGRERKWNYQMIQRELSFLVGAELIMFANDPKIWLSNLETMEWELDQKPRYFCVNKEKAKQVIENKGRLI